MSILGNYFNSEVAILIYLIVLLLVILFVKKQNNYSFIFYLK